jgi:hypothetical protein
LNSGLKAGTLPLEPHLPECLGFSELPKLFIMAKEPLNLVPRRTKHIFSNVLMLHTGTQRGGVTYPRPHRKYLTAGLVEWLTW